MHAIPRLVLIMSFAAGVLGACNRSATPSKAAEGNAADGNAIAAVGNAVDGARTAGADTAAAGNPAAPGSCASKVTYAMDWAGRLSPDTPVYPQADITEAAGTDEGKCALRIVSFTTVEPAAKVVDWYKGRLTQAGYSAERQVEGERLVLGGTRQNAAYIVYATPRAGGGTTVDLMSDAGA